MQFCESAPFPVEDYLVHTHRFRRARLEWWVTFDCAAEKQDHWHAFFAAEVFAPALATCGEFMAAR